MELPIPSSDPIALYQYALSLHSSGRLAEAAALYQQLLNQFPNNPLVMTGLGTIALQQGNLEEGARLLGLSLEIEPSQPMAHSNLGLALRNLNRLEEAVISFDRAIALAPGFEDAYNYRGITLQDLRRFDEALESFGRAIALRPDSDIAYSNRGVILQDLNRLDEALENFDRAIAIRPDSADAHCNRGNVLRLLDRPDEALASCDRAIALKPDYALAHNNRGGALHNLNRLDEALACYDRAIALKPDYAEAYYNRGTVLHELRRLDEALTSFNQAIALKPDYAEAYWNQSVVKLLKGDFEDGWKLYEWRWKAVHKGPARSFAKPLWLGNEPLPGKTLLIYAEQGFGDFIQCCRYALLAEAQGAKVVLEAPAALVALVSTLKGNFTVVEQGQQLPPFDLHCPVMSLPLAFKTTVTSVPASVPYLHPDADKQKFWHQRLGSRVKPRIGLAWAGSITHKNDHNRSIPLELLKPLLQLPVEFHALQKEIRPNDAAVLSEFGQIHLHHEKLGDFSDTAALAQEMDIIISVDTSVAHLAGALGKTVWILLPFMPDYRWMLDRADSPWYPTATLFRQPATGDWSSVIAEVKMRLLKEF